MSPVLGALGVGARAYGLTAPSGAAQGDFELITTEELTSATSAVTFSAISADYMHLRLQIVARSASTSDNNIFIRFNNDSASGKYKAHHFYTDGATTSAFADGNSTQIYVWSFAGSNETTGIMSPFQIDITDASSTTKNKTTRALSGRYPSAPNVALSSGLWMDTSRITSLSVLHGTQTQNFAVGSRFSLYGFRG